MNHKGPSDIPVRLHAGPTAYVHRVSVTAAQRCMAYNAPRGSTHAQDTRRRRKETPLHEDIGREMGKGGESRCFTADAHRSPARHTKLTFSPRHDVPHAARLEPRVLGTSTNSARTAPDAPPSPHSPRRPGARVWSTLLQDPPGATWRIVGAVSVRPSQHISPRPASPLHPHHDKRYTQYLPRPPLVPVIYTHRRQRSSFASSPAPCAARGDGLRLMQTLHLRPRSHTAQRPFRSSCTALCARRIAIRAGAIPLLRICCQNLRPR
ncbi:hypothetical protein MSAN_02429100 [Mycena sanguinolenta]|uniref:Uncharacterized protein n=1 Tax=Mycena sanguinolenta TaxID=230812 RepID=A0A8H6X2P8_9AGAR|nr:hypothetical protein MSAN_02429100 [Mycena sanguinolenta]